MFFTIPPSPTCLSRARGCQGSTRALEFWRVYLRNFDQKCSSTVERGWRLFAHDVEAEEPDFEEFKKVVLEKAKMMKKRKMFESGSFAGLGNLERTTLSTGTLTSSTPATSTTVTTVPTAVTSPKPIASDSELAELTKQLSNLTLFLKG